jgi:hypothetical protein
MDDAGAKLSPPQDIVKLSDAIRCRDDGENSSIQHRSVSHAVTAHQGSRMPADLDVDL